jgi:hypothetical protein
MTSVLRMDDTLIEEAIYLVLFLIKARRSIISFNVCHLSRIVFVHLLNQQVNYGGLEKRRLGRRQ